MLLVPKAGLEPARISTVDFESTASTDFATPARKGYADSGCDYTCHPAPCKRRIESDSLSVENFSRPESSPHSDLSRRLLLSTAACHALHFQFNIKLREVRCPS